MAQTNEVEAWFERSRMAGNHGIVAIDKWLAERTVLEPGARTRGAVMYEDYGRWCIELRKPLGSRRAFGMALATAGLKTGRGSGGMRMAFDVRMVLPE